MISDKDYVNLRSHYRIVSYFMRKDLEDRVNRSVELFKNGYNCAQSVIVAFADLYGFTESQAMMVSSGFGAGIAKTRQMCGAVSGTVMLCGLERGNDEPGNNRRAAECFGLVREVLKAFKEENGSTTCADLLGLNGKIKKPGSDETYEIRPCAKKVECAARIFAEKLEELGK